MPTSSPSAHMQKSDNPDFKTELLGLVPFLRAFARSLTGNQEAADDLAQETLVKAWQSRSSFIPGTNLKAWLFTILRNQFYSERRRAWRQEPWDSEKAANLHSYSESQTSAADLSDIARALQALPNEQREALILVGAGGFAYEEAAKIINCAVGTVKSRVARGRRALMAILDGDEQLPMSDRPPEGEAAREILSQLDRLVPHHGGDKRR